MGRRNRLLAGALLAGLAFLIGSAGCGREAPRTPLVLLHCDELTGLFRSIEEVFERANPGIDIRAESLPTLQTIRKLTDQSRRCDLIAVVDPATLRRMLCPENARWVVAFASDRLVLAAADRSRYIHEIDADNWFQILLRPDVAFARVDERLDPAGLYTRMAWKLADARYGAYRGSTISGALGNACKPNNVRPSTNDLMTLLATPSGPDYVFVYRSMAEQHRQQYIELPDEINRADPIWRRTMRASAWSSARDRAPNAQRRAGRSCSAWPCRSRRNIPTKPSSWRASC